MFRRLNCLVYKWEWKETEIIEELMMRSIVKLENKIQKETNNDEIILLITMNLF